MHNYSVSLGTKRLRNPPLLINTQHYSSRRNMEADAAYQSCLPSCELHIHSRSLTFRCTGKVEIRRLRMQIYTISRLRTCLTQLCAQSRDWNTISRLECNLRILRMRNAILRLRKFSDCVEQIYCYLMAEKTIWLHIAPLCYILSLSCGS